MGFGVLFLDSRRDFSLPFRAFRRPSSSPGKGVTVPQMDTTEQTLRP